MGNNVIDYVKIGNFIEDLWTNEEHFKFRKLPELSWPGSVAGELYSKYFSQVVEYMLSLAKVLKSNLPIEKKKEYLVQNLDSPMWIIADRMMEFKVRYDSIYCEREKSNVEFSGMDPEEKNKKYSDLFDYRQRELHVGEEISNMLISNNVACDVNCVENVLKILCHSVDLPWYLTNSDGYKYLTSENYAYGYEFDKQIESSIKK